MSHTSGDTTREKPRRNGETDLETSSAFASAMRLGTSSPTTIETYETITVMTVGASALQTPAGAPSEMSQAASGSDRVVEATMAEKNPTRVMATWMAARN